MEGGPTQAPAGSEIQMDSCFGITADELSKLSEEGGIEYLQHLGKVSVASTSIVF